LRQSEWAEIRDLRDAYERLFVTVVEDGCAIGIFTAENPRLAVRAILGALNWITVWYRPDDSDGPPGRMGRQEIAESLAHFVVVGARGDAAKR
jgi:tetracycline repressor-like protein